MKKLTTILIAALLVIFVSIAHSAELDQFTLLGGSASPEAGTAKALITVYNTWTCQVNISGSPSEVVVYLEGNVTGIVFNKMASWTLTEDTNYASGQGIFSVTNMPAGNVRGRLVTLTGGSSPSVTMICKGVQR